jgi:sugar phosphate isomerase/epimerase
MTGASALSRRSLMKMAGLAAVGAFARQAIAPGVQLYTVRNEVLKEPFATLQAIAEIGYREVEMLRSQVKTLAPLLKRVNLAPISLHFETPLLTGNWTAWKHADMPLVEPGVTFEDCVLLARDHGFRFIVFNYLAPEERLGLDFYRTLSDKLNVAARKAEAAGLRFCYHNHDFEFQPKPGGRPIDVLLEHLDPKRIGLEVDAFWVSMAGVNAAEFIREHAKRIELVHLKDRAKGTPTHYDIATVPNDTYRELGSGDLPWPDILEAVSHTNTRHVFVEQDFSKDPIASLRQSYAFLKRNRYVR